MTRQQAYLMALSEVESFDYQVKDAKLKLPDAVPEGAFYAFFEDEKTGRALCRTYLYDGARPTVSFVNVTNINELKQQNPTLVETYLENGAFLYRNSPLKRTFVTREDGIVAIQYEISRIPA